MSEKNLYTYTLTHIKSVNNISPFRVKVGTEFSYRKCQVRLSLPFLVTTDLISRIKRPALSLFYSPRGPRPNEEMFFHVRWGLGVHMWMCSGCSYAMHYIHIICYHRFWKQIVWLLYCLHADFSAQCGETNDVFNLTKLSLRVSCWSLLAASHYKTNKMSIHAGLHVSNKTNCGKNDGNSQPYQGIYALELENQLWP